jgi:hypothetical protein
VNIAGGEPFMWYSCSIAQNGWVVDDGISGVIDLANGVRLEPIPSWVKDDESLQLLSWKDREHVRDATLVFAAEYEADALGSPDPDWKGKAPRGIQAGIDEKFVLASVALWLAKPTLLSCGSVFHFGRSGDPTSLRQVGSLKPVWILEAENQNTLTHDDVEHARELFRVILSVPRGGTVWTALRMLVRALVEQSWEIRYLLQWIVLEALFGPDNSNETTYRLSQRIGIFVGDEGPRQKELYRLSKDAYSVRSKIVHGAKLMKMTPEKSIEMSTATEDLIRVALRKILGSPKYTAEFDSRERDTILDDLVFS